MLLWHRHDQVGREETGEGSLVEELRTYMKIGATDGGTSEAGIFSRFESATNHIGRTEALGRIAGVYY